MRNILAIAGKELRGYFASPIAYIVIGFFALLFGWFFYVPLSFFNRQSMQMGMGMGGAMNINQMLIGPVLTNATRGHAVPAADDHDAHLLGREALGDDRAAAHLAAHRHADHPRQVPRRDGPVRGACSP